MLLDISDCACGDICFSLFREEHLTFMQFEEDESVSDAFV